MTARDVTPCECDGECLRKPDHLPGQCGELARMFYNREGAEMAICPACKILRDRFICSVRESVSA